MGHPFSVRLSRILETTREESWIGRVRQNARAFRELRGAPALAHGGAGAFDLLEVRPAPGTRQAASLLVHAVVVGALLLLGGRAIEKLPPAREILAKSPPLLPWKARVPQHLEKPGGREGSGGRLGETPPTAGEFAARSQVVLLHPRVPDRQEHLLPVEPTVFDTSVNDLRHVPQIGLPSMKERNDSNGPGKNDGMGLNGQGISMGNSTHDGVGENDEGGAPRNGAYAVKCVYCPDPEYTDEARHEKLQGSVTLLVLVTADGRAGQVRIVKGLGLGLDERAVDTVKKWRFEPARDAARRAVAEWVTVEAIYRLF